jgi:alcohol dehydrogenase
VGSFHAWMLPKVGAPLELRQLPIPELHSSGVLVRVHSAMVLSYMSKVLDGSIRYATPPVPFVPGTNAIGVVEAVGREVSHVAAGDWVFLSPHLVADEPTASPPQILIGLTALGASRFDDVSEGARALQETWTHGAFAELAHWPGSCVTRLVGVDRAPRDRLISLAKLVVPYGGLLRAGVQPGMVVAVNGATGFYGSGAVMVALAMGAARVVAVGRDRDALDRLAQTLGPRVVPATAGGNDAQADFASISASTLASIQAAARGPVDVGLDMLGQAASTASTLATLRSLRRRGRLVVMGSASVPLELTFGEMLSHDWEVVGNFMYPKTAPAGLWNLVAGGQLDLACLRLKSFTFEKLPDAIAAATAMRDLDLTVVRTALALE